MSTRNFQELLRAQWAERKFVSVGLDFDIKRVPKETTEHRTINEIILRFFMPIIDATADTACAYKPNLAFYEAHGDDGLKALRSVILYIGVVAPHVPVILDFKRGDIGKTNFGYVEEAFEFFKADAVTVNPYLGREALAPFLACANKGIIVLCRTSNPGAGEFQDLKVGETSEPLYMAIARRVAGSWNEQGNCGLVVGATYPEELAKVRQAVGDIPILIPGVGAQGGDVQKAVLAGKNSKNEGIIVNSSSAIIYASNGPDFAVAAGKETLKLHDQINAC